MYCHPHRTRRADEKHPPQPHHGADSSRAGPGCRFVRCSLRLRVLTSPSPPVCTLLVGRMSGASAPRRLVVAEKGRHERTKKNQPSPFLASHVSRCSAICSHHMQAKAQGDAAAAGCTPRRQLSRSPPHVLRDPPPCMHAPLAFFLGGDRTGGWPREEREEGGDARFLSPNGVRGLAKKKKNYNLTAFIHVMSCHAYFSLV